MTISKTLLGSAGLAAALVAATPASAQYYGGYGQSSGSGVVGAIVNAVTGGYGQYPRGNYGYGQVDQRVAVQQCAAAAEQRVGGGYRSQGYNGYENGYGQNGYQNGYSQGGARVVGITSIERRNNGALRVHGLLSTNGYGNQGYGNQGYGGQYGNQGYGNGGAELAFSCKVTLNGQVSDLQIGRNRPAYYRGY